MRGDSIIMYELKIDSTERILIVAPHPDDECIGTGGLLALYPGQCDVIIMTDGRYGGDEYLPQRLVEIRKKELVNALALCGVNDYKFYDYEDKSLILHGDCFDHTDFSKYTKVFLPNPNDNHSDHTASYQYALESIKKMHLNNISVFQYEVHGPLPEFDCYIDISNVIDLKKRMIECYDSQIKIHPYSQQVVELAKYRACQNNCPGKHIETYREVNGFCGSSIGVEKELVKYKKFIEILTAWMKLRNSGVNISDYLKRNKYDSIAIYGYGILGKLLLHELKSFDVDVRYIIDRNEKIIIDGMHIYHSTNDLEYVDILIVTTIFVDKQIIGEVAKTSNIECVSLERIIDDLQGEK